MGNAQRKGKKAGEKRSKKKGVSDAAQSVTHQLEPLLVELESLEPDWNPYRSPLKDCSYLDLDGKKLERVPEGVSLLTNLKALYLWRNRISFLPEHVSCLVNLHELYVFDNFLVGLPAELFSIIELRYIDLDKNKLRSVPSAISNLQNLNEIHMDENEISTLPDAFSLLKGLHTITMNKNKLAEIPYCLMGMTWIRSLEMSHNQIQRIYHNIHQLEGLETLKIDHNKISSLPLVLGNITNLRNGLAVDGNIISNIPENVLKKGSDAIMTFLYESLKSGTKKWTQGRLLLLGEAEAGKTSLTLSLSQTNAIFSSTTDKQRKRTDGIDHIDLDIHDISLGDAKDPISIRIWDFGGQDEFQVTHPFFLSSGALVLILYRMDQGKERNNIGRWVKMLDDFAPGSKVIIAGTHRDIQDPRCLEEIETEIEAILKVNNKHTFLNTNITLSNQNGEGMQDLKRAIYDGMLRLDNINKDIPESFIQLKEYLETKGNCLKFLGIREIYSHAERLFSLPEDRCISALQFLHDLGSIVWYSHHESMKSTVFLNPVFLINIFRCVFSFRGIGGNSDGIILKSQLRHKINQEFKLEIDDQVFSVILDIFDHFGLGISFNQECVAFPSLMPETHSTKTIWSDVHESNCVSEVSVDLIGDGEIQLSDKSNMIAQTIRLTKGASVGLEHQYSFFRNVALIHLTVIRKRNDTIHRDFSGDFDYEIRPGGDLKVLLHIHKQKVTLTVRKYESLDSSSHFIDTFAVLSYLKEKMTSIRQNLFINCQLGCHQCQNDSLHGIITTDLVMNDTTRYVCEVGHVVDYSRIKRGRIFQEEGVSKVYQSHIRRKQKSSNALLASFVELSSIDSELSDIWSSRQIELVQYIASGAFGRVYKTNDVGGMGAVVKIQTIKAVGRTTVNEVVQSLIMESRILAECSECENIVRLFNVFRKENDFYMTMEFAGTSLKKVMESDNIPNPTLAQILSYSRQICHGLIFMHCKNLFHEDLKADNIMIVKDVAKIVDFGIVSRREIDKVGSYLPTRFGEWKQDGTSNWQAPEVHELVCKPHFSDDESKYGDECVNIGHRGEPSNVYAFALLVWYMFSGIEPFLGETQTQSFTIRGLRPEIKSDTPIAFQRLIKACWRQNYKIRPDLTAVVAYLNRIESSLNPLSEAEMEEMLPTNHAPLVDMYRGEFVEFLCHHGYNFLAEKMSKEYWKTVEEIIDRMNEKDMLAQYHISPDEILVLVGLSKEPLGYSHPNPRKKYVFDLSNHELVEHIKKKSGAEWKALLNKIMVLKIDGNALSRLDHSDTLEKYSVSSWQITEVSRLILTSIDS